MSKNLKRLFISLSCALALYSWLGFLLIPSVALSVINQKLSEYSNQPAQLQRLEFNPFNLHLQLWQLHIGQEQTTVAFEQLSTQLAWDSLWRGRVHVKFVNLISPQAWLDINKQNEVNLAQLLVLPIADETAQPEASTTEPIMVQVDHISIEQGQLKFSDQRPRQPVAVEFSEFNLQLENLNTAPDEQGQLQLSVQAHDGTQLSWQGDLSLEPLHSSGHLEVNNIALSSWWPYVADQTQLALDSGRVSFSSDYQISAQPDWQLVTRQSALDIQQLGLSSQQQPLMTLERFTISETALDMQQQRVHIGRIRSHNLSSWVSVNPQAELNWLHALAPSTGTGTEPGTATNSPRTESAPETPAHEVLAQLPWRFQLDTAELSHFALNFDDASRAHPVALKLHQLNLEVTDFDSHSDTPATLNLSSQIGEQGELRLHAQIKPQSLHSTLDLHTSAIDLRPAQAWITPYARVELLSGLFNSQLTAQLHQFEPLHASAQGELSLSQLHLRDQDQHRDLLKWRNLQLQDLSFTQAQHTEFHIGRIIARHPYARVVIDENLHSNLSQIMVAQPDSDSPSAPESTTTADSAFTFSLGEVMIEEGSAHFADFSLTPHFATAIQDLNGRIGRLDNQPNTSTPITITGAVDRYAPVTIEGALTPFDPLQKLDIDVNFKHVELTTLTPYSGKFAGYRIHKGRLNLALNYQIEQGQLNAHNSVLLEDFQLGEAVQSPDAIKLPLRLAVALLKDNRGNIEIKLPVKGDLSDPQFSVMPIVWQTLRNLITRAVSAPFKMLGNLAGDSHDLSQVSFSAGQSELSADAKQALASLAQALKKRPQLKLNIEGTSSAVLDGPPMAQQYLHYRMQELHYIELQQRGRKLPESIQQVELSQRQQNKLLEQLYHALPESIELGEELPRQSAERLAFMQQHWLNAHTDNSMLLRTLAQNRAKAIRQHLAEQEHIDPARLFLIDVNEKAAHQAQAISSLLHLDAL